MNSLLSTLLLLSALVALALTLDVRTDPFDKIYDELTKEQNEENKKAMDSVLKQFPNFKIGRSHSDSMENSDGNFIEVTPEMEKAWEEFKKKYHKKYQGHSSTSTTDAFSKSDSCESMTANGNEDSSCEISATWDFAKDGVCFKSTYYKKAYLPGSANASNGVEKCEKTLCGATKPVTTDCKEAFGSMFSSIPTVNL